MISLSDFSAVLDEDQVKHIKSFPDRIEIFGIVLDKNIGYAGNLKFPYIIYGDVVIIHTFKTHNGKQNYSNIISVFGKIITGTKIQNLEQEILDKLSITYRHDDFYKKCLDTFGENLVNAMTIRDIIV